MHLQEVIDCFDELRQMPLDKVALVRLQHEVLVDLLSLNREEASRLLYLCILAEDIGVLKLLPVLWIVSHQELA